MAVTAECLTPAIRSLCLHRSPLYSQDAEFLTRNEALPPERIRAVETGGCPHAAIREDVSSNLAGPPRRTRAGNSSMH